LSSSVRITRPRRTPTRDAYQEAEQKARGRRDLDVVLLSADSLETIKLTHSSYFEPKSLDELLPA
jgi:hypothetical protein